MALSEVKIRNAKPAEKPVKLYDGEGLFLLVTPSGGKLWRFKYRYEKKEKLLAMGTYPAVSLALARRRKDEARGQLTNGVDPGAARKALKQAAVDTFELVALEWFDKFTPTWVPAHAAHIKRRLEIDIFPWLGSKPVKDIKAPELLSVLRRIESRGALNTAHRVRIIAGQIFRYAVATGKAERDPSGDLRGALPPAQAKHRAALIDPKEISPFLRALEGYQGSFPVACALRLAPLFFVRPGELRQAEWAEIDLDTATWSIPAARMKMRQPHIVPLATQAVEILTKLQEYTGGYKYVFPSIRTRNLSMSKNTVSAALRTLGYNADTVSEHGFRATARTILDEVLNQRPDFIEHQLAHAVRDPNGRAYNRTSHLEERRKMMQLWADYLDELKAGAVVIPFEVAKK